MINCFVEMVTCGVKKLALGPPLVPEDFRRITFYSERIVQGFGVKSYLEKSLLVTKLQFPEFTRGKWLILYYKTDNVLQEYFTLKERKIKLEKENRYVHKAAVEISRECMRLLSYLDDVIKKRFQVQGRTHIC